MIRKIDKNHHDFFKNYDKYRNDKDKNAFERYQNKVTVYINRLKSNGYQSPNIKVLYYFKGRTYTTEPDIYSISTLVEVSNGQSVIFSEKFDYPLFKSYVIEGGSDNMDSTGYSSIYTFDVLLLDVEI